MDRFEQERLARENREHIERVTRANQKSQERAMWEIQIQKERVDAENRWQDKMDEYKMKLTDLEREYESLEDGREKEAVKKQYDTVFDMRQKMIDDKALQETREAQERNRRMLVGIAVFIIGLVAVAGVVLFFHGRAVANETEESEILANDVAEDEDEEESIINNYNIVQLVNYTSLPFDTAQLLLLQKGFSSDQIIRIDQESDDSSVREGEVIRQSPPESTSVDLDNGMIILHVAAAPEPNQAQANPNHTQAIPQGESQTSQQPLPAQRSALQQPTASTQTPTQQPNRSQPVQSLAQVWAYHYILNRGDRTHTRLQDITTMVSDAGTINGRRSWNVRLYVRGDFWSSVTVRYANDSEIATLARINFVPMFVMQNNNSMRLYVTSASGVYRVNNPSGQTITTNQLHAW